MRSGRLGAGVVTVAMLGGIHTGGASPTGPPPGLAGNVTPTIDRDVPPGLAVAASGVPYHDAVPVVLRNGTSAPVRGLEVRAAGNGGASVNRSQARDAAPAEVSAGGLAIAIVPIGTASPGTPLTLTVRARSRPSDRTNLPVERVELSSPMSGRVAQRLTGRVRAPRATGGPAAVVVVCFNEASRPATWARATTPGGAIDKGARVAFVVEFADLCPAYLVGATAPFGDAPAGSPSPWGVAGVIAVVIVLFGGLTLWLRPRWLSASRRVP
jgi:hypothetical protein